MQLTNINLDPSFKQVNDPLRNIGLEIAENRRRLETIHNDLLQLRTTHEGESAWSNYLNPAPDQSMRRQDLRSEAEALERRQQQLESALAEGNMAVNTVRGKLSRKPCQEARPLVVAQIKKILRALDTINETNATLTTIVDSIEGAGFKVTGLPPAELDLHGFDDSYRGYVKHHFAEIK
jgi:DNA repair exonuclease SbcCD ATPase subunit